MRNSTGLATGAALSIVLLGQAAMKKLTIAVAAAVIVGGGASAQAGTVFSDNFNSYASHFNWVPPPAVWTVPVGSVDLIGETTTFTEFDFFPGNGGYVDLDGSTEMAGTLATTQSFVPGKYTLTFDLGGNARGDVNKTTTISLGDWSTSLDLASSSPYQLYTYTFTTTGGNLSFADNTAGNQNIGNIVDNVSLSTAVPEPAVPEPATWAMMLLGFAGLGYAGYRKTRTVVSIA